MGGTSDRERSEVLADVDRRQYLVTSEGACLLVLGEVYYPGGAPPWTTPTSTWCA